MTEVESLRATIEQQAAEIVSLTTQRDALSKPGTPGFYLQGLFELAARYGGDPAGSGQHAIAFIREKLEAQAKELADLARDEQELLKDQWEAVAELDSRLEIAEEALKIYTNPFNWGHHMEGDRLYIYWNPSDDGMSSAQAALAKIREGR